MYSTRLVGVALALSSLIPLPSALTSAQAQDAPVFRTKTDLVLVPVTVTDGSGRFVFGLKADQFELLDEGSRRPLAQFSAERVPVSLAMLAAFKVVP